MSLLEVDRYYLPTVTAALITYLALRFGRCTIFPNEENAQRLDKVVGSRAGKSLDYREKDLLT
ncbi:MAG: hypothetical protein ACRD4W_06305 [Nitrososphaeraceae archaeon]